MRSNSVRFTATSLCNFHNVRHGLTKLCCFLSVTERWQSLHSTQRVGCLRRVCRVRRGIHSTLVGQTVVLSGSSCGCPLLHCIPRYDWKVSKAGSKAFNPHPHPYPPPWLPSSPSTPTHHSFFSASPHPIPILNCTLCRPEPFPIALLKFLKKHFWFFRNLVFYQF